MRMQATLTCLRPAFDIQGQWLEAFYHTLRLALWEGPSVPLESELELDSVGDRRVDKRHTET
jgi:hypothetical protein